MMNELPITFLRLIAKLANEYDRDHPGELERIAKELKQKKEVANGNA